MQIVSEEVCSIGTSVAIVNSKEGSFGPIFNISFIRRFHNIQNYGHSIFVIVSNYSLICVRSISFYYTVPLYTAFRGLMVWQHNFCRIWKLFSQKFNCFIYPYNSLNFITYFLCSGFLLRLCCRQNRSVYLQLCPWV